MKFRVVHEIQISEQTQKFLKELFAACKPKQPISIEGGFLMFVVEADHADVPYSITAPTATDSEGNAIENPQFEYAVTSTDEAVVSLVPDEDENPLTGVVHFGAPGIASVNVQVSSEGTLLGSFGAQFTVTAGDPAAITGGTIQFDGLTES